MNRTSALDAFACPDCGASYDPGTVSGPCPDCEGFLQAEYDLDAVALSVDGTATSDPSSLLARTGFDQLLPFSLEVVLATGCGETPLVETSTLAGELGVERLAVKDEGCNPTGAISDREMAVAVATAAESGATAVALPTMGNGGQAAAAAAARAGLDSHSFVPSRTPFVNKAMINVHGGDMTVVEGRYRDALAAFGDAIADADWATLAPFATPFRHEGTKPIAYEITAVRGWSAPDVLVVPTGQVTGLVGVYRGFCELAALDVVEELPRLVAAEAAGCAPLSTAWEAQASEPVPIEHPDTVCGQLEIPDPAGGRLALDAIETTGGSAVAVDDDAIMEGAATLAEAGGPTSVTGGAAVAAVRELATANDLRAGDDVVLVNPVSANKEADLMRSHLMSKGR